MSYFATFAAFRAARSAAGGALFLNEHQLSVSQAFRPGPYASTAPLTRSEDHQPHEVRHP